MCGFVGFTGEVNHKEVVLENMLERIIHRGPDQVGTFIGSNISLGFRRLSIIDINSGCQPLFNEDGTIALVFNGEIYNHNEIREELKAKGHVFKTMTDSEVLVHAYEEYKEKMLDILRGMFAFVIYDTKSRVLFGARDHFGIKPLYYSKTSDGNLLFGSEIKSFLEHPNFVKEVNTTALKPYLTFQYSVLDETFFKGVYKLPAGHYFRMRRNEFKVVKYWDIDFEERPRCYGTLKNATEIVLEDSIKEHSNSEVPVGSFLSGGVDSSYIAAKLMPDKTFSVGFEGKDFDESNLARDLSDMLEIENIGKTISSDECFEKLSLIQYHLDEPQSNPSTVPLYFLSELAREHVTVALSGEGADEIFGGYDWYKDNSRFKKLPKSLRDCNAKIAKALPNFKGRTTIIRSSSRVEDYFIGQAQIFEERESDKILKDKYKKAPTVESITDKVYSRVSNKDDLTKKQYLDLKLWLQGDILLKADKMSMAHSLEVRVPFLDKEVMRVASGVASEHRIKGDTTKYMLRDIAKDALPEEWAKREKKGFPVPIRIWLKENKYYNMVKETFQQEYVEEFFSSRDLIKLLDEHYNGKKNNARKIWTVYVFLVWYERFFILEN